MVQFAFQERTRSALLWCASGTVILWAALANLLVHNDYPIVRPEVVVVGTASFLAAGITSVLYVGQRQWGRSVLEAVLVLLFLDLNGTSIGIAAAVAFAVAALTFWQRISILIPATIFASIILLTTVAGLGGNKHWIRTETTAVSSKASPPQAILHILLDEQAGVHGIYPDADGLRLRSTLRDFFLDRGFTLYGRAYSEHMHTVNAIPAVLNFGRKLADSASDRGVRIGSTAYFKRLDELGYSIEVLQSDFADLCSSNPITRCTTYMTSSLRPTLIAPLSTYERAQLIGLKLAAISSVVRGASRLFNRLAAYVGYGRLVFEPGNTSRTSTVGAIAAMDLWTKELKHAQPGHAYFAHLLLPHYPHVVRRDCSFLPWKDWELRRSRTSIEQRRVTYAEQDRCTLLKLDAALRAFNQSPGGKSGIIIIHGDHGSRIQKIPPVTELIGRFSNDDVIAAHATLFAVRQARPQARYDETPQPISNLLRAFVESDFMTGAHPSPASQYVLSNSKWEPKERATLPRSW